jgi:hypothetical protein
VSLQPGTYGFQQQSGAVADFSFRVTASGTIDYDPQNDGFLSGRGSDTLVVRGFPIALDMRPLSHSLAPTLFGASTLTPDHVHQLTLVPAPLYGFISASGVVANFTFAVRVDGTIGVDSRFAGFTDVTGRTLTVKGHRITLDTSALSHSLVSLILGFTGGTLTPGRHDLMVVPGMAGYSFVSASGVPADCTLFVTAEGTVVVDPRFAGFAEARGRTLIIKGYRVTLDTRALSHALVWLLLGPGPATAVLPPGLHELTVVPGTVGYSFVSASGVVASFRLVVSADGTVTIDSAATGIADVNGRTVTIGGHRITLDTRALSHAVVPLLLGPGPGEAVLPPGLHELVVVPGISGYSFVSASGVVANFTLTFNTDGSVAVDPRYAGFAQATGRTLTIRGYRVSLDTGELTHDVIPLLLGWSGGLLPPGLHDFTAIPASGYGLQDISGAHPTMFFSLDAVGTITLTDAPPGVTVMSSARMCAVPDNVTTPLQIQAYGAPDGRWISGQLTVSVDLANAPSFGPALSVTQVIAAAFQQWQAVLPTFFNFTLQAAPGDIHVRFGGRELDTRFGASGDYAGSAQTPPSGRLHLDSSESWTPALLQAVVLHEIGHVLGLKHSTDPASTMYPISPGRSTIDGESQRALRNLYGWRPQIPLSDKATSDRPSLAVTTSTNLTSSLSTLRMIWKGTGADQSLYESALENNAWTPQQIIEGTMSSHSPAIAPVPLNDGTPSTGLIMVCKGAGDDSGLYFATRRIAGWSVRQKIPNVGSSHRPALAEFGGVMHLAWKGVGDDHGIYWSRLTPGGWEPQKVVRGVGTDHSPALVAFQGRLFMFWKGIDESRVYFTSRAGDAAAIWGPQQLVQYADIEVNGTVLVPIGSSRGPSVTPHRDQVLLTWKGIEGDQGIYFSFFDGNEFTGQIRVADVGTSEGPGACRIGSFTHMAWKGVEDDNVIYWSTLPG